MDIELLVEAEKPRFAFRAQVRAHIEVAIDSNAEEFVRAIVGREGREVAPGCQLRAAPSRGDRLTVNEMGKGE